MPRTSKINKVATSLIFWLAASIVITVMPGCATPLTVQSAPVERVPLALAEPAPLRVIGPQWFVVTPDNIDSVWEDLKKKNIDLVLFAVTDTGYEQLSVSYAEIRNLIAAQRGIIIKYKDYYEKPKEKEKDKSFMDKLFGGSK